VARNRFRGAVGCWETQLGVIWQPFGIQRGAILAGWGRPDFRLFDGQVHILDPTFRDTFRDGHFVRHVS
jgi:hypothetical protein